MLFFYRLLINLIALISPIIILVRLLKKKEHPKRFLEKFCFFFKKKNKGKLIWFHGSSVGEILSIIPLIEKLEKNKNVKQILVTSSTLSSSSVLKKLNLKKTIHQFFPVDTNFLSKKFLNYWKPSVAIFVESEIWPNMILNISKKSIPLLLLNARITKKSFNRWNSISSLSKILFGSFDNTFPQNNETKKYLKILGAKKIKMIGNLKFCENEIQKSYSFNNKLKKFFQSKKIWCASSTHETEEKMCAIAHNELKKKYKNLLTIIIPRHVHRVKSIAEEIKDLKLNYSTHSSEIKFNKNTEIYLVDTYGETKYFFNICKTVFLGGSIIPHGGQNPLESIRFGCNVIHGPNTANFKEIYDLLKLNGLSKKINNSEQLIKALDISFNKKGNSLKKINKIKKIGSKILDNTFREVEYYIKKK
tara:strand:- start:1321 stop:2574 length:1254 start_codon:yes stop_codon:yes gene_type:complete